MNLSISADQTFSTSFYVVGIIMFVIAVLVLLVILHKASVCGVTEVDKIYGLECGVVTICSVVGTLMLAVGMCHADFAKTKQEWIRFKKAASVDSGYTFYYNGQAVSGAALGIDENDIGGYKIKYDPVNKTAIIWDSRD